MAELSPKQQQVMAHAVTDDLGIFAGGAVRSGKTHAANLSYALWAAKCALGYELALLGNSIESCMRNVGFGLIEAFRELGIKAYLTRSIGTRVIWEHGGRKNNIWVIGASDERSRKRIQGLTLKGLMIDECCLVPQEAFNMALSRLSVEGAKFWATFNPEAPQHWLKREVIDHLDHLDAKAVYFGLDDNPTLSEAVKERYRRSFTGHWKRRYIDGEWAGATGLIFPTWHESDLPAKTSVRPILALDWGVSTVLTSLCIKVVDGTAHVVSEYYHDSRTQGVLDEHEHIDALTAWYCTLNPDWALNGVALYIDPTAPPTFKRRLRKAGFNVRMADHDVVPGIVSTATRLSTKDILIGDCPNLVRELQSYSWDARKADAGVDAPTKIDDHAVDALRYYGHTTGKIIRAIGRNPSVREVLNLRAA